MNKKGATKHRMPLFGVLLYLRESPHQVSFSRVPVVTGHCIIRCSLCSGYAGAGSSCWPGSPWSGGRRTCSRPSPAPPRSPSCPGSRGSSPCRRSSKPRSPPPPEPRLTNINTVITVWNVAKITVMGRVLQTINQSVRQSADTSCVL